MYQMKKMADKASKRLSEDGVIRMVEDKAFLEIAQKEPYVVLCMWHKDFFRTDVLLNHLKTIAEKQPNTVFLKMNAEESLFVVRKLGVRMLPALYVFIEGKLVDAVVGFDDFGGQDKFKTTVVWRRLQESGVIEDTK